MASTIKLKNGTGEAPDNLAQGEVAINTSTGIFYFGDPETAVKELHRFNNISASGHITASGNISASGNVFSTRFLEGSTAISAIYSPIAGGSNIVTVGTIGTGVWNGTAIASSYIAADAITGAKIADDAINSEHYTDGSIDNAHIADDAIDSEHYAAGSIDTAHIADAQVTLAKQANLAADKIVGRANGAGTGVPTALTAAQVRTVINVEDGSTADQTKSDIDGLAITTVGTVDTGVWNGTAIASAYLDADTAHLSGTQTFTGAKTFNTAIATGSTKHLIHYKFMGFNGNNSTANGVYEYSNAMQDTRAPLKHDQDHNATITTAMDVSNFFTAGGQIVPRACTVKKVVGWAHTNGSSAEHNLALVRLRPVENNSGDINPVLVQETTWTSLGNDKLKSISEDISVSLNAGDMLMTMIKDDTGSRTIYFNITIEVEF